jgi:hypothetical protein
MTMEQLEYFMVMLFNPQSYGIIPLQGGGPNGNGVD